MLACPCHWCKHGGQRTTLDAGPHLPVWGRQSLLPTAEYPKLDHELARVLQSLPPISRVDVCGQAWLSVRALGIQIQVLTLA